MEIISFFFTSPLSRFNFVTDYWEICSLKNKIKVAENCYYFCIIEGICWLYLSGTLSFSHGFEASVPVQQLEHSHQLLEDKHSRDQE